jgi:predicted nucleotidyltransferase
MPSPEPELDFHRALAALASRNVRFIVIGGVAAALQGAPIATFDLDVVHSREHDNVLRLVDALAALRAYYREHSGTRPAPQTDLLSGPGHHLLMTDAGPLDILGQVAGDCGYDDLVDRSIEVELEHGMRIRVLLLAELIRLKELLGREKDWATLAILRRTLEESSRG